MLSPRKATDSNVAWVRKYPVRNGKAVMIINATSLMDDSRRVSAEINRRNNKYAARARKISVIQSASASGKAAQSHSNLDSDHKTICPLNQIGTAKRQIWNR